MIQATTPTLPQGGIIVDSGAAESVLPREMFQEVPKNGLHFVTASGSKMPNLGEEEIHFKTEDGLEPNITFQVTDARNPLASVAKNSDDDSAASPDPGEHTAMMHSRYRETIAESAARFIEWSSRMITPDPIAKMMPERGTTSLRVVDPYDDPGVWVIVDEGANSNTHSDYWMRNATAKWAKRDSRPF